MDNLDDGHAIQYSAIEKYLSPSEISIEDEQKPQKEYEDGLINFHKLTCHIYSKN